MALKRQSMDRPCKSLPSDMHQVGQQMNLSTPLELTPAKGKKAKKKSGLYKKGAVRNRGAESRRRMEKAVAKEVSLVLRPVRP